MDDRVSERPVRDPIERLARRICWMEFTPPRRRFGTEASYWRSLPDTTKDNFREEARRLMWALRELYQQPDGTLLLQRAALAAQETTCAAP